MPDILIIVHNIYLTSIITVHYPHFKDEKIEVLSLSDLPRVTQLVWAVQKWAWASLAVQQMLITSTCGPAKSSGLIFHSQPPLP